MKRGKGSKIKLGGFELFCLILFAWPLLVLFVVALQFFGSEKQFIETIQEPLVLLFFSEFIIYMATLVYNLKNPFAWVRIETKSKWKLCTIFSLIGIVIDLFLGLNKSLVFQFISGFIGAFLFLTGANTLVLWLAGKATFTSQTK